MFAYDYRDPTPLELAAFNSDPRPGELFTTFPYPDRPTTLHRDAVSGERLEPSTTVPHTIDVLMTPLTYNDYGWWDPHGHLYLLADTPHGVPTFSEVVSQAYEEALAQTAHRYPCLGEEERESLVLQEGLTLPATQQEPLFLRCNHTNVMQLSLHNRLERNIPGTPFDSAWPKGIEHGCTIFANYRGECGLHVHIVKFDPIACDGASTGWNYISSPRFGKKMVYRWWADEEFGTIFTHDHMFANYRQKHGLFGCLLVEPKTATFHDPYDLSRQILTGQNAVIAYEENGQIQSYREFCLANGDWIPLFKRPHSPAREVPVPSDSWSGLTHQDDGHGSGAGHGHGQEDSSHQSNGCCGPFLASALVGPTHHPHTLSLFYGKPLEPPTEPDSHDDNGVFGLNYRCEPLPERPRDPSEWFSSKSFLPTEGRGWGGQRAHSNGDPATPLFHTWPGERIRLRLMQGSHEEQHSFQIHGLRWRRFWKDPISPLRNQQSLGISEAFSFDIDQPGYGPGDYLWKYASAIDLWLGTWGLIRSLDPAQTPADWLPRLPGAPPQTHTPTPPPLSQCRRYKVVARHRTVPYGPAFADPFGLVYEVHDWAAPGEPWMEGGEDPVHEEGASLLQTQPGSGGFPLEIHPLVLRCRQGEWVAVELFNDVPAALEVEPLAPEVPLEDRARRVSNRVSLHADLLGFDVRSSDGSNVGLNPDTTVPNRGDAEDPTLPSRTYLWHADGPLGPVGLMDMADIRNHRHHGLVGALVVLESHLTPVDHWNVPRWVGPRVSLRNRFDGSKEEEMVLLAQDGLRYFLYGNPKLPIGDPVAGDPGENELDDEDQGLKGFNYRSEPSSHARGYAFTPSTPLIQVEAGARLQLHLVGACDRPRQHSFTLHGHGWKEWPYLGSLSPWMSSTSGITSGTINTFNLLVRSQVGDYMYRSGVLKWVVEQGMWGLMRVSRASGIWRRSPEGDGEESNREEGNASAEAGTASAEADGLA